MGAFIVYIDLTFSVSTCVSHIMVLIKVASFMVLLIQLSAQRRVLKVLYNF